MLSDSPSWVRDEVLHVVRSLPALPQGACVCVSVCVCVCVFIVREGILATLSYSGVLQRILFRAKKLGYLKPLPGYLPYISVLYQKRQQALQARGVHIGADSKPTPTQTTLTNHTHTQSHAQSHSQ